MKKTIILLSMLFAVTFSLTSYAGRPSQSVSLPLNALKAAVYCASAGSLGEAVQELNSDLAVFAVKGAAGVDTDWAHKSTEMSLTKPTSYSAPSIFRDGGKTSVCITISN